MLKFEKDLKMSFKNLVSNLQEIRLPYIPTAINYTIGGSDRIENINGTDVVIGDSIFYNLVHKDYLHFPIILCVFETKTIFINHKMKQLPEWVLEAFILHEKGHLQTCVGCLDTSSPDYLLGENMADEYSQTHCGRMYEALLWYYDKYPIFLNYKRLEHLEKVFKLNHRSYLTKVLHKYVYSKANTINP